MSDDGWTKTDRGWVKRYGPARSPIWAQSDLACPRIISDGMDPVEHIDGRHYDSKSAFRAVTKANGYVEVGNDPARLRPVQKAAPDPKARREAVNKAVQQVLGA